MLVLLFVHMQCVYTYVLDKANTCVRVIQFSATCTHVQYAMRTCAIAPLNVHIRYDHMYMKVYKDHGTCVHIYMYVHI